ncbi:SNF2 family N-terminal domain-containing protein [Hysterangium stoloniferum]|nr:SNF2 family N-terminal domain-containing protein [Hysterangium stoloniferum]
MSSEANVRASRNAALASLKFKKNAKLARANAAAGSEASITSTQSLSQYQVPAQSRDATLRPSQFTSNSAKASVDATLASNSHYVAPDLKYKPHQSRFFVSNPPPEHHLPSLPRIRREADPLSVPSGFIQSNTASTSSGSHLQRPPMISRPFSGDDDEEGPPRKRINHGASPMNPITIESSPEMKMSSKSLGHFAARPDSPDSDMPDAVDLLANSPPNARIVRGPRPDSDPATGTLDSVELTTLILTNPHHSRARVISAFKLCEGDPKAANTLIQDSSWHHDTPTTPIPRTPSKALTSTISGSTSKRAAEKEKGKKSMIYAKRQGTAVSTSQLPIPAKQPIQPVFESPMAPRPAKKKIVKRIVDSSGSEAEYSDGRGSDGDDRGFTQTREDQYYYDEALKWLNECEPNGLVELAGITLQQAETLIALRPFEDIDDINSKLSRRNKTGLSRNILEYCKDLFKGYKSVDDVLEGCERIGEQLREAISKWNIKAAPTASTSKAASPIDDEVGALALINSQSDLATAANIGDYIATQPSLLADTVQLKDYQLLGVNWMHMLYQRKLSCILADEMGKANGPTTGLGKTVQVIAFLALLKERGPMGPHLIVVPSSTLENWIREFMRFAPSLDVRAYYGSLKDRVQLRQDLRSEEWDVLVTTYALAQGDERDRKFFRKYEWQCCIFDEGHVLKNFDSQRYHQLMKIDSKWRLLLTGTPLQNNLQELVSLMNFILPRYFAGVIDNLRAIFKVKADRQISLLARDRVSRAKRMMTPFVLRRRKDMVLDLPEKSERIEWCEMTALQKSIYRDALQRSRKAVLEATVVTTSGDVVGDNTGKGKKRPRETKKAKDTSTNVLMDLRKAASHPMLFRRLFDDSMIKVMARQCMKEPDFCDSNYHLIVEDMEVMTDAELQAFSLKFKSVRKFAKEANCFEDAGKIKKLLSLLDEYERQERRVLIFSQFTQILDILQAILKHRKTRFLLLTGATPVDIRQSLVDEFNEDETIPVFLLSTKAGGMGINLTAASVVILFDQDFNPHNDRQAADRAYRIGQKRNVDVIKLITRSTIEEDMFRLGQTKLALDEAVAGEDTADGEGEGKAEKKMKSSLLSVLREQFEKEELRDGSSREDGAMTPDGRMAVELETPEDLDITN